MMLFFIQFLILIALNTSFPSAYKQGGKIVLYWTLWNNYFLHLKVLIDKYCVDSDLF